MKDSIVKTEVDRMRLTRMISECISEHDETYDPHIIMNSDTFHAFKGDTGLRYDIFQTPTDRGRLGVFCGYKIFIDDEIPYGDVEVR